MVINHVLNGMILQVWGISPWFAEVSPAKSESAAGRVMTG